MYALATKTEQKSSTTTSNVQKTGDTSHSFLRRKSDDNTEVLAKLMHAHNAASSVQPKLTVGPAGDEYEREADMMGEKVARAPESKFNNNIQRSLKITSIRRKGGNKGGNVNTAIEREIITAGNSGAPLQTGTRNLMESHFNVDFSKVRIHSDDRAAKLSQSIGAQAFTYKNHIYFDAGKFSTDTPEGKGLLAHELTHVVQQGEAVRLKPENTITPRVQRLPFGLGKSLNKYAVNIPGWKLLTLALGYNPLTEEKVPRTAKNYFGAIISIVPGGALLIRKIEEIGLIDTAFKTVLKLIENLQISLALIERLLSEAWDEINFTFFNVKKVLIAKFAPLYGRIVRTIKNAASKLVALIKNSLTKKLNAFLKDIKGFKLLTVILEKNPVTNEVVRRTPVRIVGGVMELVPGGTQKFNDLHKSGALTRAFTWLGKRVEKLGITFTSIKSLFIKAWNSLTIKDVLNPINAFKTLASIFGHTILKLFDFAKAVVLKVAEFTFIALLGPTAGQIIKIFKKSKKTFNLILKNPIGFAKNIMGAIKKGFNQFSGNILIHLKAGLIGWVLGSLKGAGIVIPETWNPQSGVSLVLQVLGITKEKVRGKLVKVFGEKNMARLEKTVSVINLLITKGPGALWEKITEFAGNLKDKVVGTIRDWVVTEIIKSAIVKILSMLNPVGALVQAVLSIYNTIMFFIERIDQILELVKSIIDSIYLIAIGNITKAANFVEKSMANTLPIIISFLAGQVGLGNISKAIKNVIKKLQKKVDLAMDKVISWIVAKGKALLTRGKSIVAKLVNWWKISKKFKAGDGQDHQLFFEGTGPSSKLMIASEKSTFASFIKSVDATNNDKLAIAKAHAIPIAERIDSIKIERIPKGTNKEEEAANKLKADRIDVELENLSGYAIELFGSLSPSAEPKYQPGTPFALRTRIEKLTIIPPPKSGKGSIPTQAAHSTYDILNLRRDGAKGASYYIRGHLLNHNLHGHGEWYNMTPLSRAGNSKHEKEVESKVKKAVDSGATVEYEVIPQYNGQPNKDNLVKEIEENDGILDKRAVAKKNIVQAEEYVPSSLKCSAKTVAESKAKWDMGTIDVDNPVARTYDSYQLDKTLPPSVIYVNKDGAKTFTYLPGIGEITAQKIIDYRNQNNSPVFSKVEDLKNVTGVGEATVEKINKKVNEKTLTINF